MMRTIASGLHFPEGPIRRDDGSWLLVEIESGDLTRIDAKGVATTVAHMDGGPNGAAIGPDGKCYICNNGGFKWYRRDHVLIPVGRGDSYITGTIQRVDLQTSDVSVCYSECEGQRLNAPNDLVFDKDGGLWFTDHGHTYGGVREMGAIYYARIDRDYIKRVIFPLDTPNGIGIAPDGETLYVSETQPGRVWQWRIVGPGEVMKGRKNVFGHRGELLGQVLKGKLLDSLAVSKNGDIHVATIGAGVTVFDPSGTIKEEIRMQDPLTTNVCFDRSDDKLAWATLSSSGALIEYETKNGGAVVFFN